MEFSAFMLATSPPFVWIFFSDFFFNFQEKKIALKSMLFQNLVALKQLRNFCLISSLHFLIDNFYTLTFVPPLLKKS